jgi:hypothetical protein
LRPPAAALPAPPAPHTALPTLAAAAASAAHRAAARPAAERAHGLALPLPQLRTPEGRLFSDSAAGVPPVALPAAQPRFPLVLGSLALPLRALSAARLAALSKPGRAAPVWGTASRLAHDYVTLEKVLQVDVTTYSEPPSRSPWLMFCCVCLCVAVCVFRAFAARSAPAGAPRPAPRP